MESQKQVISQFRLFVEPCLHLWNIEMFCLTSRSFSVLSHMQIEALTKENQQLSVKLEVALGKLELVCGAIFCF